jgi:hypothetical protein
MRTSRWARLRSVAAGKLRLGAWYPVEVVSARDVSVLVHGRVERVARALVELREQPPREWTVVRGPFNAARVPASAREGYVVCPNCRHREPIPEGRPAITRCGRCNGAFAVAWEGEAERAAGVPGASGRGATGPETLRGDLRMTRRRAGRDRRAGAERRTTQRRVVVIAVLAERRMAERRAGRDRRAGVDRRLPVERRRRSVPW